MSIVCIQRGPFTRLLATNDTRGYSDFFLLKITTFYRTPSLYNNSGFLLPLTWLNKASWRVCHVSQLRLLGHDAKSQVKIRLRAQIQMRNRVPLPWSRVHVPQPGAWRSLPDSSFSNVADDFPILGRPATTRSDSVSTGHVARTPQPSM